jgi:methane/ammonia monooxygenase subunit A
MLTIGDWDFWLDWKDREWWITLSPALTIVFCAALQGFFWKNYRLPIGATFAVLALLTGEWIVRISGFHTWSHYPINLVTPATFLAGALALDAVLLLTRSMLLTAILGAPLYALLFFPSNWTWLAAYHVPVELNDQVMTVADLIGYEYIRSGTPEYIRIIERGTLRTFGQHSVAVSSFFAAFLCSLVYFMWWFMGKAFSTVHYIKERF